MKTWKAFKVKMKDGFVTFAGRSSEQEIPKFALPASIARILDGESTYEVRRVATGGVAVRLVPCPSWLGNGREPAQYLVSGGLLCRKLCRLLGYTAKKPETIRVKIRRVSAESAAGGVECRGRK